MPPKPEFDLPLTAAIYMLTCDGKDIYCGSSTKLRNRIHNHFWRLKNGKHKSSEVQELYDKISVSFSYRVVEYCDASVLLERERYWTAQTPGLLAAMPLGRKWSARTLTKKSEIAKRQMADPVQYEAAVARARANAAKINTAIAADPMLAEQRRLNGLKGAAASKARLSDPTKMEEHREGIRRRWANPEYRERVTQKIREGRARGTTS